MRVNWQTLINKFSELGTQTKSSTQQKMSEIKITVRASFCKIIFLNTDVELNQETVIKQDVIVNCSYDPQGVILQINSK